MINLELLKKLTFIADITQHFEHFEFEKLYIKVNTLLDSFNQIDYAFKVLRIPYITYIPSHEEAECPEEINVNFGHATNLKAIYLITYILKEVCGESLDIYISYATNPEDRKHLTLCGSYIKRNKGFTNISRPIKAHEILRLDVINMDWEQFSSLFPNINYSSDGRCIYEDTSYYYEEEEEDEDYDYYGRQSYGKYSGSYAQEVEGLSDDFIDDVLGGEPDAYWNID